MGRSRPSRPERLPEKLVKIRRTLGLTQEQIYERIKSDKTPLHVGYIGSYETGEKLPSMLIVLRYARIAGIPMDVLVDDELDLPGKLKKSR